MLGNFRYVRVGTLNQAVERLGRPGAYLHAGGTDLLGCLRDRVFEAREVVSISSLPGLRAIEATPDGGLRLGALLTLTELAKSERVRSRYPVLSEAAASAASPQLRNQGTLGGNLCQRPRCWYFRGDFHCVRKGGDTCYAISGENRYHCIFGGDLCYIVHPSDTAPALVALGARVTVNGPRGARTVPVEEFFVLPGQSRVKETVLGAGELVTEVILPPPWPGLRSTYRKVRERAAWDFALVSVALALRMSGSQVQEARVVLGGVAPVPWRSREAERVLTGSVLDGAVAARAGEAAVRAAEPMGQNDYKVPLLSGTIEETVLRLAAQ